MASTEIKAIITAEDRASSTLNGFSNKIAQSASEVNAKMSSANKSIDDNAKSIKEVGGASDEAGGKVDSLGTRMGNMASSVRSVGSYIAGYQLIQSFRSLGELALGGAAGLEQNNMAFQSLIGNAKDANMVFGQLVQYANKTPFESKDIIQAAQTLMGFNVQGKDTVGIIKNLGDVTAVGGGDLKQLSLVTGQVFAQGKLRAQDMYQVINDGGAGLINIMAKNAGGMQNLTAQFDKGGIPAKAYFDAINEATSKGGFAFEGAQKQAHTFNGYISTLKDSVQQFAMKLIGVKIDPQLGLVIEPGGLFDKAKGFINGMTQALSKLAENKTAIMAIAGAIGGVLLGTIIAVVVAIGWIPIAIVTVASIVGAVVAVIVSHWQEWHKWIIAIGALMFPFLAIFIAVGIEIKNHWSEIVEFFKQTWSNIKQWGSDAWQGIQSVWNGAVEFFKNIAGVIVAPYRAAFNLIADIWNNTVGKLHFSVPNWIPGIGGKGWDVPDMPHFAMGIKDFSGGLAVVGERGPEIVNLPQGSNVIPNNKIGSSDSNTPIVNITINAGAYMGSQQDARKYAMIIMGAYNDAMKAKGMA